ncbi:hypothetical protein K0M31_008758 [Melipona bicolor]|uniref:Uncharacterized protein n=1 Tax=Melipona bicolor TaxID=60889 RepID=A0AA40FQL2_9HYME|nr:hypothetical protein K0M31_008758 [Melipona bicolor]
MLAKLLPGRLAEEKRRQIVWFLCKPIMGVAAATDTLCEEGRRVRVHIARRFPSARSSWEKTYNSDYNAVELGAPPKGQRMKMLFCENWWYKDDDKTWDCTFA